MEEQLAQTGTGVQTHRDVTVSSAAPPTILQGSESDLMVTDSAAEVSLLNDDTDKISLDILPANGNDSMATLLEPVQVLQPQMATFTEKHATVLEDMRMQQLHTNATISEFMPVFGQMLEIIKSAPWEKTNRACQQVEVSPIADQRTSSPMDGLDDIHQQTPRLRKPPVSSATQVRPGVNFAQALLQQQSSAPLLPQQSGTSIPTDPHATPMDMQVEVESVANSAGGGSPGFLSNQMWGSACAAYAEEPKHGEELQESVSGSQ